MEGGAVASWWFGMMDYQQAVTAFMLGFLPFVVLPVLAFFALRQNKKERKEAIIRDAQRAIRWP